ncbi:MAG: HEAT repeat domain-containing protein [Chloroflexi bacterium]|nr:HEAT repeat domain-containing protein [Chloroflexota bacterium]
MNEFSEKIKFTEVSSAIKDIDHPFPAKLLRGFSDLSSKDIKELILIWPNLPLERRIALLEDLEEITECDTLVNFDELAKIVIVDENPMIRVLALRLLWESEDSRLVPGIIDLMLGDPDEAVRATSAGLLGRFAYLGEMEKIPSVIKISVVKNLQEVATSEDLDQVRLRALESLGYSSNPKVPALIRTAYSSNKNLWVASSLCAMGRSADDQWADLVIEKLHSGDSEILFEAVRASGELELTEALDPLLALLDDNLCDSEVRLAAIWSLSQIGGDEVKEKLQELLADAEEDEEIEWIEKAIENLELNGNPEGLELFDFEHKLNSEEDDFLDDEGSFEDEIDLEELNDQEDLEEE